MLCFNFLMQNSLQRELLVNESVSSQGVVGRSQLMGEQGEESSGIGVERVRSVAPFASMWGNAEVERGGNVPGEGSGESQAGDVGG